MKLTALAAAALVVSFAGIAPATSAPLAVDVPLAAESSSIQTVQWRGRGYHHHHGGYGRRGGGWGPAIGGLAAGAIIGGAIASSQAQAAANADAAAYCAQRFRSYDPGTGTYLANDGYRRSCP